MVNNTYPAAGGAPNAAEDSESGDEVRVSDGGGGGSKARGAVGAAPAEASGSDGDEEEGAEWEDVDLPDRNDDIDPEVSLSALA